jgi:hypothetical protein
VGSARKPNTLSMHENSGRKTTETTGTRDFAAAGISFSTNLYRNVADAFANTLPLSQEGNFTGCSRKKPPFSVFFQISFLSYCGSEKGHPRV